MSFGGLFMTGVRRTASQRRILLAAALLLAGISGSMVLYQGLQQAEQQAQARNIENMARYMKADMLGNLQEQINALQRMSVRLAHYGFEGDSGWRVNADLYLSHYSYYEALAVLDRDLRVSRVRNRHQPLVQRDALFPVGAIPTGTLDAVNRGARLGVTQPFQLSDQRPAVTFLTPIGDGQAHFGYLAAVLVIPEAVDAMIPAMFRDEIVLRVEGRGEPLFGSAASSGDGAQPSWDASFTVDVDGDGEGFLFNFAVSDALRSQLTTGLPEVVLGSGIVVSLLLAAIALLGMNAVGQARVLTASNRRLEQEVGERQAAERELAFLVHNDALTGIPNRAGITLYLEDVIRDQGAGETQLALLFLDLDQFKDINDSLGHQLGDELLCEVPQRLKGVLKERDFVGRHGGDEFLIAVERDNRQQVEQLAGNILRSMDSGFAIGEHRLFVSASIGIAYYPESGHTVSELIQNADTALFKAKNAGRNQFAVFTREMFAQAQHRLNLSRDIRHALEREEFRVVYQPIINLRNLSLCGVEALLRWQHEKGYMVPPQEFIRVAEETGIIGRLGAFVLDQALADLAAWSKLPGELPWLAVNVSGAQIQEHSFAEQLSVLLHQYRIDPQLLHLEITEEILIENLMRNRRMLHRLDEIGMRIVVDDFGVGYSSLSYLKNFPISVVKIDRGFIRDLSFDPEDQAITRTICSLASDLGMLTVAEGVESVDQLHLLRNYRCSFAQGFLFSRPVEADSVAAMIGEPRQWRDIAAAVEAGTGLV